MTYTSSLSMIFNLLRRLPLRGMHNNTRYYSTPSNPYIVKHIQANAFLADSEISLTIQDKVNEWDALGYELRHVASAGMSSLVLNAPMVNITLFFKAKEIKDLTKK